jgi:hypothetical protein
MTEWRLFDGAVADVSTAEFHKDRPRVAHLEQPGHRERLFKAADYVRAAVKLVDDEPATVSDLGCGDGGLLSLIRRYVPESWGYDFGPANAAGWAERGVKADLLDVFGADSGKVRPHHRGHRGSRTSHRPARRGPVDRQELRVHCGVVAVG